MSELQPSSADGELGVPSPSFVIVEKKDAEEIKALVSAEQEHDTVMCMIDCEEFSSSLPHFACVNDPRGHSMCITCFADYVNHCCESWATLNTIPIKCQIPNCGYVIPEATMKSLLNSDIIASRGLWEKYSQIQLKVALAQAKPDAPEVPVTCAFCGNYSEFYIKAAPDYWSNAEKDRFKAKAAREEALFESTKRMQAEMERRLTEFGNKAAGSKADAVDQKEFETKLKEELEGKRREMVEHIMIEIEDKFADEAKESATATSQFFVCRNLFCDGAYCLKCETFLKKEVMQNHNCSNDPIENLYSRVVEALATASTRTCPNCGSSGMKDLACTHITCEKCSHRFCYICGVAESSLQGGFGNHNQWNLDTPESAKKCPMYLHYRWGDRVNIAEGKIDGDPARALEKFHSDLQIDAMQKLKEEVDDNKLWDAMEKKKFPTEPLIRPKYQPPRPPPIPWWARMRRNDSLRRCVEKFWLVFGGLSFVLYLLFFFAMYCWMIHAGRMHSKNNDTCSESKLASFAIVHASMAWFGVFAAITALFVDEGCRGTLSSSTRELLAGFILLFAGGAFVTMFGTFVWGAVMFYRTSSNSCAQALWMCLNYYFNGVWVTSGTAVFMGCCFLMNAWAVGL